MKIMSNARWLPSLLLFLTLATSRLPVSAAQPPQMGSRAPEFSLKTLDGNPISLSAETAQQPVVLVMLRGWPGYQCPLCTQQVNEFVKQADAFAGKAQVIMVYPGPADDLQAHAKEFLQDKQWPKDFIFVIDSDYAFTQSYGLRWEAPGETAYPSTFVIDTKGMVKFRKISKSHGGRSTPAEALAAVSKLQ